MLSKSFVVNSGTEKNVRPAVAISVAGFDPSSGAGISADLKVFAAHAIYGVAAITALTVQSTMGVRRVEAVAASMVRETLDCLAEDLELQGVKIGMLGTAAVVETVAAFLRERRFPRERVVLDPVLRSSSGRALLEAEGTEAMRRELLPLVGWVTPNTEELSVLTGRPVQTRDDVVRSARELAARSPGLHVVATGGHLDEPDDLLLTADGAEEWFRGRRVETTSTHGTGCVFSSALLCRLMAGEAAAAAVRGAKAFVSRALETAVKVGRGKGPVFPGIDSLAP